MLGGILGALVLGLSTLTGVTALPRDVGSDIVHLQRRKDWLSPEYKWLFQNPLPIPPVKQPLLTTTNPDTGKEVRYYEIEIKPFTKIVYPGKGPASFVGYDGIAPGPTFVVPRGVETFVRFINKATIESSIHLHGSPSRAPWDGWAEDVIHPGQYKDYYFPNFQEARTLWYHDHAMHYTAENAYKGQAGMYLLEDPVENALGLPSGYGVFDIPLVLSAKQYNNDGSLTSTEGEDDSFFGDIIEVNGQPWPYLNVEPRKYRFRLLDAAVSRSFALYFVQTTATGTRIPFKVIGSDAGLLTAPQTVNNIIVSMGERYEIVFDFSAYKGKTIELRNLEDVGDIGTDDDYKETGKVMRFIVSANGPTQPDTSVVPSTLRNVHWPTPAGNTVNHHFRFEKTNSEWRINGVGFADVQNRVLANVPRGTVEIWELENSSGGWTHPVHIHLIDFKVLSRTGGRTSVMPYEAAGLKDVVYLAKGETVKVQAHYAPFPGVYMFHCHNLIHEDQDMMAAFNVTVLDEYGYNSTSLANPMQSDFLAKPYVASEMTSRTGAFSDTEIINRIKWMCNYKPYSQTEVAQ